MDSDCDLGYFQFNESAPFRLTKAYSNHGAFSGGASLVPSAAVVGGGQLATVNVPLSGNLVSPMGTMSVGSSTTSLGTELKVYQLTSSPPNMPEGWFEKGGWWIVTLICPPQKPHLAVIGVEIGRCIAQESDSWTIPKNSEASDCLDVFRMARENGCFE